MTKVEEETKLNSTLRRIKPTTPFETFLSPPLLYLCLDPEKEQIPNFNTLSCCKPNCGVIFNHKTRAKLLIAGAITFISHDCYRLSCLEQLYVHLEEEEEKTIRHQQEYHISMVLRYAAVDVGHG